MVKKTITENQFEVIKQLIAELNDKDRKNVSDKLLSYLLFDEQSGTSFSKKNTTPPKASENTNLSEEEIALIKELAKRTEDLKNLLGEDPGLFM